MDDVALDISNDSCIQQTHPRASMRSVLCCCSKMSAPLLWETQGLDKSRFEAYAKLLRLRNGGQIEEASDFSERPDEPTDIEESESTDSVDAKTLPWSDDNKLKRAFLDRLSELVANQKGGYHVSSALMIEWPDRVDVLVAKNSRLEEGDPMLKNIALSLQVISRHNSEGLSHFVSFFVGHAKEHGI